jgi:hypothetical protein
MKSSRRFFQKKNAKTAGARNDSAGAAWHRIKLETTGPTAATPASDDNLKFFAPLLILQALHPLRGLEASDGGAFVVAYAAAPDPSVWPHALEAIAKPRIQNSDKSHCGKIALFDHSSATTSKCLLRREILEDVQDQNAAGDP